MRRSDCPLSPLCAILRFTTLNPIHESSGHVRSIVLYMYVVELFVKGLENAIDVEWTVVFTIHFWIWYRIIGTYVTFLKACKTHTLHQSEKLTQVFFLIYRSTNPNEKRFKVSFSGIKHLSSKAVSKIDDLIDQASGWSLETLVTSSIRNLEGLAPLHCSSE